MIQYYYEDIYFILIIQNFQFCIEKEIHFDEKKLPPPIIWEIFGIFLI